MEYLNAPSIEKIASMRVNGIPANCIPWEFIEFGDEKESYSPEEVFGDLFEKYGKSGALLGGVRHREGLTQREFAKMLNITQSNLSAMENGRRTIGKNIAKRIQARFKLDYRMFL
jgi:DNA-binding XRE family transcriptional regulator